MNVREALEKLLLEKYAMINANNLAPIIERALRAAWERGYEDCLGHETGEGCLGHSKDGVTAGVAAMMGEK